ncbi:MAG TPA: hypothetical protein VFS26_06170, partial [Solirubrobacterales bacterium]|nr:hypothetical protein [Solirubrobacterales bacterium]
MFRGIRGLLAVTAMAFVLVAAFATAAQAVIFRAETGGAEYQVTGTSKENFVITVRTGTMLCLGPSASATLHGAENVEMALAITSLGECVFSPTMGSCHFVLHSSGTLDIEGGVACSVEPIEFNRNGCVVKIGPQ